MIVSAEDLPDVALTSACLLLDVDGTLLDIAPAPDAVEMPLGLVDRLAQLSVGTDGALALVSGRTIAQLDELFAPLRLPLVGSHGGEIRFPDGHVEDGPLLPAPLKHALKALAAIDPRIMVEDKHFSLAFHYRLAPEAGPILLEAIRGREAELERHNLQILRGKAIIEIKPLVFNKGTAVKRLLAVPPFVGRRPYFAGDDITDNDVFAELAEFDGVGISVGRKLAGARYEAAAPAVIRDWLARLARVNT